MENSMQSCNHIFQIIFRKIFRQIIILSSIILLVASPAAAVSDQRKNIERNPFYDKNAEAECLSSSSTPTTTGGGVTSGGVYVLGDSIGEGMRSAGLEDALKAKGFNPKLNVDQSRSITGRGVHTNTTGIEAIAADTEFIKNASAVVIELGTNPENNFPANLTFLTNLIKANNNAAKIYYIDVAASASAAARIGAANSNKAIYQAATTAGTPVISRFKLYYPNGDPQTYTNLPSPASAFDSLGVHSTNTADYTKLNDALVAGIGSTSTTPPSGGGCSCPDTSSGTSPATANLTGSDNQQKAFNYFISKGFTPQQSAGIIGNLVAESGVNPKRVQSTDSPKGDKDNITVNNVTGYGIAQWTSSGRQQGLVDFARARGMQIEGDLALQLDYLTKELTIDYKAIYDAIKVAPDLATASSIFMTKFERPKDQSSTAQAKRASLGDQVLALYGGGAIPSPGGSSSSGSSCSSANGNGSGGGGMAAGFVGFPLQVSKARMTQLNGGQFKNGTMTRGDHPYAAYDILADPGTPVVAILDGKVVGISTDKCPGRLVSIYNESQGVTVAYLHMSIANTLVQNGQQITAGQIVGYVGQPSEGCGTPHLHIDANDTNKRIPCKRESCPAANQVHFEAGDSKIGLGAGLFNAYEKLP